MISVSSNRPVKKATRFFQALQRLARLAKFRIAGVQAVAAQLVDGFQQLRTLMVNQAIEFLTQFAGTRRSHVIAASRRDICPGIELDFQIFPDIVIFDKGFVHGQTGLPPWL